MNKVAALMSQDRFRDLGALLLCTATGFAFGLEYGGSNHATYVPPGLHIANPSFLAHDWWMTHSVHYHWAFFVLVAGLALLDSVPWGLALLNVSAVSGSLFVCYRLIVRWLPSWHLTALTFIAASFLVTKGFWGVAVTYLFSSSLQASSFATLATIASIGCWVTARYGWAAMWLSVGGIFHANFLLLNIALFGLSYVLLQSWRWQDLSTQWRIWAKELATLLGPSLIVAAAILPLIFAVSNQRGMPEDAELARYILFEFRAPHHYLPSTFSIKLLFELLAWQILGFAWTNWAVRDPGQRRRIWALQLALFVLLWSATALTTIVFVEVVSRLFFWRLVPFAQLLAAMLLVAGTLCALRNAPPDRNLKSLWPLLLSAPGVAWFALLGIYHGTKLSAVLLLIPMALVGSVALRWWKPEIRMALPSNAPFVVALILWMSGTALIASHQRFSLIAPTEKMQSMAELYTFIRENTPATSQFATPPGMQHFRLFAGRAIVADFKSVPLDPASIVDWYQRLEALSGTSRPADLSVVRSGYRRMNASRLDGLREQYDVTHILIGADHGLSADGWYEVFRNAYYRVLEFRPRRQTEHRPVVLR